MAQILFSGAYGGNIIGHFIAIYYDTEYIYVYDSMNSRHLSNQHFDVLNALFENSNPKPDILIHHVQQETNGIDCGIFAAANLISCLNGENPSEKHYDEELLRFHFSKILTTKVIEKFPCVSVANIQSRFIYFFLASSFLF